ncbi:cadherin-89D-like [Pollicipes pollicipes]|uniref:cadherin-89D-like n=1 Tax=Pollicipes pollicipes TaxID=41117 RepID=UPI00188508D2|nr:cadherin-89D-like [Pollicipes pollicipes]
MGLRGGIMAFVAAGIVLFVAGFDCANACRLGTPGEPSRFERVPESLEPGTHVLVFEVDGADRLTLRPISKDEDFTEFFRPAMITNDTGGVVVAQPLTSLVQRREPVSVVKFRVLCESPSPFTGSDSLLVTLYIEDVNDHPPVFVGDPYQVTVDELTPKGMVIYDGIMAKDKDKANTANSDIYYWISNGNENLKFSLSPLPRGGAAVVLEKPFDFENGDREMNLTITASDRGAPARLSRAQLTISVKDGDDQPPLFTAAIYRASVTEYPGPQMRSLQLLLRTEPPILAYDGDLAIDQRLNYRIRSGNTGQHFSMDSATGALTLVKLSTASS